MTDTQLPRSRFLLLRLIFVALILSAGTFTQAEQARRPNIVFVLADDLGWSRHGASISVITFLKDK